MFADVGRLLFQPRDALPGASAVDLQFGFSGPPAPDSAGEPGHGRVFGHQPGQHVFQLGEFHLQFSLPCPGALGENVQDQLGSVNDLEVDTVGERADLGRVQILVENDEGHGLAERQDRQVLKLAKPHEKSSIGSFPQLQNGVGDDDPGGTGQLPELIKGVCGRLSR